MLFNDKLHEISAQIIPEFDRLFDTIIENQVHFGDLLLIHENGFYYPEIHNQGTSKKFSPYMIGPSDEGFSAYTHYEFIHNYRTQAVVDFSHAEYLDNLTRKATDTAEELQHIKNVEEQSIHLEMLIYLKIWEADLFIKRYYQVVRLLEGLSYDWHFKIAESNRDEDATGKRHVIIRNKIRDKFQAEFLTIYQSFKTAYLTQVRNSIAHSKFSFHERNIQLGNQIQSDPASQLNGVSFDEWINMFHHTLILYNEQLRFIQKARDYYSEMVTNTDNICEVMVTRQDPEERVEYHSLKYRPDFDRWHWLSQDDE